MTILYNAVCLLAKLSSKQSLNVLTYHRVGEEHSIADPKFMSVTDFEQQIIWLKRYFNVLDLPSAMQLLTENNLPERAVVISIDDGYIDSYTTIFPLLKKHGLSASFFIATSGITTGYLWDEVISSAIMDLNQTQTELIYDGISYDVSTYNKRLTCLTKIIKNVKYQALVAREAAIERLLQVTQTPVLKHQFLSAEQIKEMHDAGMCIGAHTVNHPILSVETDDVAKHELAQSKEVLEDIIRAPIDYLAYPNGRITEDFEERHQIMAEELGFKAAFATDWGSITNKSTELYRLKRFTPWHNSEVKFNLRLALNYAR